MKVSLPSPIHDILNDDLTPLSVAGKYPTLLPHFCYSKGTLRTLNGQVVDVPPESLKVIELMNGQRSVDELELLVGLEVASVLSELEERRIVIRLPPPMLKLSRGTPDILVLSPHIDDAALSVGGILARLGRSCRCHVLNVFSEQSYQTGLRVPPSDLKRISYAEESLVAECLGYHSFTMGLSGAQDRHSYSLRKIMGHTGCEVGSNPRFQREIDLIAEHLSVLLAGVTIALAPLGLGGHLDHVILSMAAQEIVNQGVLPRGALWFYEDLPYSAALLGPVASEPALRIAGVISNVAVQIGTVIKCKRYALNIYRTKLRAAQIDLCIDYASRQATGHPPVETLWGLGEGT
jgi:LmbE family N-acetylglucosaminyl deacetylase